jgi:hypothetical protein
VSVSVKSIFLYSPNICLKFIPAEVVFLFHVIVSSSSHLYPPLGNAISSNTEKFISPLLPVVKGCGLGVTPSISKIFKGDKVLFSKILTVAPEIGIPSKSLNSYQNVL